MKEGDKSSLLLKRELGLFTSTLLVVGLLVGSGVFKKIIPMSQTGLGEISILLAWAAAGAISLLGAFSVGGLASLTDESGGTYEYFRLSFGKFIAFLSGWADYIIIGTGASAAMAYLFAQTVNAIVTLPDPLQSWEHISIAGFIFPFANSGIKLVGIAAIVVLTGINSLGTRKSGIINNVITMAKISGIILLIILGLLYTSPEVSETGTRAALLSPQTGLPYLSAFLTAMLAALWAYEGWVFAANISGEIRNPKRNVPLALAFGIMITMALYILINFVYMHIIPLDILRGVSENEIGAVLIAEKVLGTYGRILLLILIVICVMGALNSNVISLPRKYFRMAQEGYFFKSAGKVHPRFRTPVNALLYSMSWSCLLLISGSFDMLSDMVIFTGFVFYAMLCIALIKLKRNGTIKTRVTGYPIAPVIFLLFSAALTINTIVVMPKQSFLGLLFILSGIPFYYFFRSKSHQK